MKKILIVDNRPPQPKPEFSGYPFVIYRESIPNIQEQNPAELETVFIHGSNTREKDWASDNSIKPRFIFGGDIPQAGAKREIYSLPRNIFYRHIGQFLQVYKDTGRIDPSIFFVNFPAKVEGEANTNPMSKVNYFQFSEAADSSDPNILQIHRTPIGTIDHIRTIAPLSHVSGPVALLINETYINELDGIDLAFKIRISAFLGRVSRWPIYLSLHRKIIDLIHTHLNLAYLLLSPSVRIIDRSELTEHGINDLSVHPATELSLAQHLEFLSTLTLPLPEHKTPHDLTNQWAAFRVQEGYHFLSSRGSTPYQFSAQALKLLAFDYYAIAFSRTVIRAETGQSLSSGYTYAELFDRLQLWKIFLGEFASVPRAVLLIDDEAQLGWHDAIRALFVEFPSIDVVSFPRDQPFSVSEAMAAFSSRNWDLVFCDLRLTLADRTLRCDMHTADQLTGIQLIKQMKHEHPALPVVAFTASEKHWTYRQADNVGADAWWTKENPQAGLDHIESLSNVINLLDLTSDAVRHKGKNFRLWSLIEEFNALSIRNDYLGKFEPQGIQRSDLVAVMKSIKSRLYSAYGYLDYRPNSFRETTFYHFPLNLAFLNLWSCTNELFRLYFFENISSNDYLWLTYDGTALRWMSYATGGVQFAFSSAFRQLASGSASLARGGISDNALRRNIHEGSAPFAWMPNKGLSPDYIVMLIRGSAQSSIVKEGLEADFQYCRNTIRNKLNLEHGDYQTTIHASLVDVEKMINIIEKLLIV